VCAGGQNRERWSLLPSLALFAERKKIVTQRFLELAIISKGSNIHTNSIIPEAEAPGFGWQFWLGVKEAILTPYPLKPTHQSFLFPQTQLLGQEERGKHLQYHTSPRRANMREGRKEQSRSLHTPTTAMFSKGKEKRRGASWLTRSIAQIQGARIVTTTTTGGQSRKRQEFGPFSPPRAGCISSKNTMSNPPSLPSFFLPPGNKIKKSCFFLAEIKHMSSWRRKKSSARYLFIYCILHYIRQAEILRLSKLIRYSTIVESGISLFLYYDRRD